MFTPIIYLTARTAETDRETAEESGAFAFFTKPFKSEELLAAIQRAVGEA
jgi:DNA-binding response OmpR family regulator